MEGVKVSSHVLVLVPVYNEQPDVLEKTIAALRETGFRILIIDDGSSPPVGDWIAPEVVRLRHSVNLGQGAALQTGMSYARARADIEVVVHFDADGQHSPSTLTDLLRPLQDGTADIVFGSRFIRAADRRQIPLLRRWTLQLGRVFNRLVAGWWMTDAHIGLRAMNRRAFDRIVLRENRMAYATELLWQIKKHSLRWKEVPVTVVYTPYSRAKGQSSWNAFKIGWNILLRLIYR